jgi:hypothetical protein
MSYCVVPRSTVQIMRDYERSAIDWLMCRHERASLVAAAIAILGCAGRLGLDSQRCVRDLLGLCTDGSTCLAGHIGLLVLANAC